MKFILGKKLEMTQIFKNDGNVVPATAVLVEPNIVTQIKNEEKEGYSAVQVGFGKPKHIKKAQAGHMKGITEVKIMKEFRVEATEVANLKRGDVIGVDTFDMGDTIKVVGTSKGKGFQGVVKRHGFHGSPKTHGHKDQERMPGSIGAGGVQRVFKGVRMAGHMGDERVTIAGLEIVGVDTDKSILYIKGAIPGARNGLVLIYGPGEIRVQAAVAEAKADEEVKAEIIEEPVAVAADAEVKTEEVKPEVAETNVETVEVPVENQPAEEIKPASTEVTAGKEETKE